MIVKVTIMFGPYEVEIPEPDPIAAVRASASYHPGVWSRIASWWRGL